MTRGKRRLHLTPSNITTFGPVDARSLEQIQRCRPNDEPAVLCADHHPGYSMPIGGVVGYRDYVSPSGVGFDIACGNKAVKTNLKVADVDIPGVMDEIFRRVQFGIGRNRGELADAHVLNEIADFDYEPIRDLASLAANQLGTVGGGNHYVDLFSDEDGNLWIGVHFGSRGFGHRTATHFLSLAGAVDGMDVAPALIEVDTELGAHYLAAMQLAGDYAYAGRDVVCDRVLEILGARSVDEVHNHHNYAWLERHDGEFLWVVRKGATPAFPEQRGFVGGSMGEISVILRGIDSDRSRKALHSTVHGAGRVMSRTKAAGKFRRRKRFHCSAGNCDYVSKRGDEPCPTHPERKMLKRWVRERKSEGLVDYEAVKKRLSERGIEIRGGGADEAPEVYKRLPEVLDYHIGTVTIETVLHPVGIAMAGADPFKG